MSQNQSYFWQTTRHNVYLKRSARLHMLLALMAVMTFSTICIAEVEPKLNDDTMITMGVPTKSFNDDQQFDKDFDYDVANKLPNSDATKSDTKPKAGGFIDAFSAAISVILFTELGDKTFFIAAIMAMRHPRLIIFTGAITALALMTILSVVFGMAATIIPKVYTYYISTALFAIFGLKMIYEGYFMKPTDAQEELEEVQSSLRKHEDEMLRSKYDDGDSKRKNSNSDKEDVSGDGSAGVTSTVQASIKNSEMHHRQRKQPNNYNLSSNNKTKSGCELNNDNVTNNYNDDHDDDDDDDINMCNERDVFLDGGETIKMSTFHSSPALSGSALSTHTEQTHCDEFSNSSPNKLNYKFNHIGEMNSGKASKMNGDSALVHSNSTSTAMIMTMNKNGNLAGTNNNNNSINSISSLSINSTGAAGQPNGELKQLGGSKKRLERDVTATLVQDPESGIVRTKQTKKSAAYLTTRVFMQAFTMTFLAEWGDRSQLTTIILAASKNVYGVIAGGIIGHSICTGLAVIGGRMVAAKISVRTVTILGGIVFLGFALYALIVKPDDI